MRDAKNADSMLLEMVTKGGCGFFLKVNEHRNNYKTFEEWKSEKLACGSRSLENTSERILQEMKRLNTVVELRFHPNTPITYHVIYHFDVEKALKEALELFA